MQHESKSNSGAGKLSTKPITRASLNASVKSKEASDTTNLNPYIYLEGIAKTLANIEDTIKDPSEQTNEKQNTLNSLNGFLKSNKKILSQDQWNSYAYIAYLLAKELHDPSENALREELIKVDAEFLFINPDNCSTRIIAETYVASLNYDIKKLESLSKVCRLAKYTLENEERPKPTDTYPLAKLAYAYELIDAKKSEEARTTLLSIVDDDKNEYGPALFLLGVDLRDIEFDLTAEDKKYLERAEKINYPKAQTFLARMYATGQEGYSKDFKKSFDLLLKAALVGRDYRALYDLGILITLNMGMMAFPIQVSLWIDKIQGFHLKSLLRDLSICEKLSNYTVDEALELLSSLPEEETTHQLYVCQAQFLEILKAYRSISPTQATIINAFFEYKKILSRLKAFESSPENTDEKPTVNKLIAEATEQTQIFNKFLSSEDTQIREYAYEHLHQLNQEFQGKEYFRKVLDGSIPNPKIMYAYLGFAASMHPEAMLYTVKLALAAQFGSLNLYEEKTLIDPSIFGEEPLSLLKKFSLDALTNHIKTIKPANPEEALQVKKTLALLELFTKNPVVPIPGSKFITLHQKALAGDLTSQSLLGYFFLTEKDGIDQSILQEEGVRLLKNAAKKNDGRAHFLLSERYETGLNREMKDAKTIVILPKDKNAAKDHLMQAHTLQFAPATFNLYKKTLLDPKNYPGGPQKALQYLLKTHESFGPADIELGNLILIAQSKKTPETQTEIAIFNDKNAFKQIISLAAERQGEHMVTRGITTNLITDLTFSPAIQTILDKDSEQKPDRKAVETQTPSSTKAALPSESASVEQQKKKAHRSTKLTAKITARPNPTRQKTNAQPAFFMPKDTALSYKPLTFKQMKELDKQRNDDLKKERKAQAQRDRDQAEEKRKADLAAQVEAAKKAKAKEQEELRKAEEARKANKTEAKRKKREERLAKKAERLAEQTAQKAAEEKAAEAERIEKANLAEVERLKVEKEKAEAERKRIELAKEMKAEKDKADAERAKAEAERAESERAKAEAERERLRVEREAMAAKSAADEKRAASEKLAREAATQTSLQQIHFNITQIINKTQSDAIAAETILQSIHNPKTTLQQAVDLIKAILVITNTMRHQRNLASQEIDKGISIYKESIGSDVKHTPSPILQLLHAAKIHTEKTLPEKISQILATAQRLGAEKSAEVERQRMIEQQRILEEQRALEQQKVLEQQRAREALRAAEETRIWNEKRIQVANTLAHRVHACFQTSKQAEKVIANALIKAREILTTVQAETKEDQLVLHSAIAAQYAQSINQNVEIISAQLSDASLLHKEIEDAPLVATQRNNAAIGIAHLQTSERDALHANEVAINMVNKIRKVITSKIKAAEQKTIDFANLSVKKIQECANAADLSAQAIEIIETQLNTTLDTINKKEADEKQAASAMSTSDTSVKEVNQHEKVASQQAELAPKILAEIENKPVISEQKKRANVHLMFVRGSHQKAKDAAARVLATAEKIKTHSTEIIKLAEEKRIAAEKVALETKRVADEKAEAAAKRIADEKAAEMKRADDEKVAAEKAKRIAEELGTNTKKVADVKSELSIPLSDDETTKLVALESLNQIKILTSLSGKSLPEIRAIAYTQMALLQKEVFKGIAKDFIPQYENYIENAKQIERNKLTGAESKAQQTPAASTTNHPEIQTSPAYAAPYTGMMPAVSIPPTVAIQPSHAPSMQPAPAAWVSSVPASYIYYDPSTGQIQNVYVAAQGQPTPNMYPFFQHSVQPQGNGAPAAGPQAASQSFLNHHQSMALQHFGIHASPPQNAPGAAQPSSHPQFYHGRK